ncbi:modulator protein [Halobacillus halophilus]|uniref:RsbR family protein n=1 Tax=Halobacillus halophilus (strain ATCC 35676 / DSM 2266 / JCM 20832 / KCTC 3685 / LMG 17431 / NBRC 102448 / NCIMB 2269) TaxID=866895 RepID=I0JMD4_HALH3|nr:STAS domain-containing protein [Halobacillus halophilus]ASF39389.1 modulator protein [Halobacillus halophilus]CCG45304.1 RsbR family protein [Halobacillus halophilus DSM 2266]
MQREFKYIGEKIINHKYQLAKTYSNHIPTISQANLEKRGMDEKEYMSVREELVEFSGEILFKEEDEVYEKVQSWARKVSSLTIEYGISLTESLRIISAYQPIIWDFFQEELELEKISPKTVIETTKKIDRLVDLVVRVFGEVHENHNRQLAATAYSAMEELSVPVVPVAEGLVVIPLVGEIDTSRAELIKEVTLTETSGTNIEQVIFDISGVPILDTMVSNELFNIIQSLKLLGIETSITGIRPSIAQTITSLGIDFSNIHTCATLQQALAKFGLKRVNTP